MDAKREIREYMEAIKDYKEELAGAQEGKKRWRKIVKWELRTED